MKREPVDKYKSRVNREKMKAKQWDEALNILRDLWQNVQAAPELIALREKNARQRAEEMLSEHTPPYSPYIRDLFAKHDKPVSKNALRNVINHSMLWATRDKESYDMLVELAALMLERKRTLPPELLKFAVRHLRGEIKRPPYKSPWKDGQAPPPITPRNLFIGFAVTTLERAGMSPTIRKWPKGEKLNTVPIAKWSICDMVADFLNKKGENVSGRAVAGVFDAFTKRDKEFYAWIAGGASPEQSPLLVDVDRRLRRPSW